MTWTSDPLRELCEQYQLLFTRNLVAKITATEIPKQDERRETIRSGVRVGRNKPCPCGSGKKYKRCCR